MRPRTLRFALALLLPALLLSVPLAPAAEDHRLQPADLEYRGAFRLPGASGGSNWEWSGDAMAYRPDGDSEGPKDGYPGSLFAMGHDHQAFISEIGIPAPAVPKGKDLSGLKTARTLQPFADIRGGHFRDYEMYRCGLAYLPGQDEKTTGRLHFCWGQHMQEGNFEPTHGWCAPDLANAKPAGPWRIGKIQAYSTNDYLLPIPPGWAAKHVHGMTLATGRFRDGGQGGLGPSLVAYRPAAGRDQPGTALKARPLLLYSTVYEEPDQQHKMRGYHHSDLWTGAAWLTSGNNKSAVVFVGTKGQGKCWYGFADGTVWPDEAPYPEIPPYPNDQRGWWSTTFVGQMLFYDPEELAAVAADKMKPYRPQPYAALDIDKFLVKERSKRQPYHVRAAACDRRRGLLYVFEFLGDEDKCLVHAWRVRGQ